MGVYIKGMGNISPQNSWGDAPLLANPIGYAGDRLKCIEPDYSQFVDVKQLRRMSRIIKMGVAAGSLALQEAGLKAPNGIITGTSYGCLEDTGIFLSKMIESNENALNPTPFIQSTHNTIGSQIALLLQCQGYNQTYTQRAFSFEHALIDALLDLKDNPDQFILAGGMDEITNYSHALQKRFGIFRRNSSSSLDLFKGHDRGTLNGEGAAYFVLSGIKGEDNTICLDSAETFFKPAKTTFQNKILSFLESAGLRADEIDMVMIGKSGDKTLDIESDKISSSLFSSSSVGVFKHLCGEYPTASAFALWLSISIMRDKKIPDVVVQKDCRRPLNNVLIYNSYFANYHSLILLRTC